MKKIFFTFVLLFFPLSAFAELEPFLSTANLSYGSDVWTSENYPDADSSKIKMEHFFHREDIPYSYSDEEVYNLIGSIFSGFTLEEKNKLYEALMSFQKQNLSQYLAFAVDPNSDTYISDKTANGIVLTPFESTFQKCGISLVNRQNITKALINNIYNKNFSDINSLKYIDIRFGDCIIPFPDVNRAGSVIPDSFPSNQVQAQAIAGTKLDFGTLEDEVSLLSLADVTLSASYTEIQKNNILDMKSTRVEADKTFSKQIGKNKILFVHQNSKINPFVSVYIRGNSFSGFTISGKDFDSGNALFIQSTDSEEKRTIEPWQKVQEGIYKKTILQENTFTKSGAVFIPRQSVGASTYYAIIYNYDTSAPTCDDTFFSHDNLGNENFIFPESPWFHTDKYGYFLCGEDESECLCDDSIFGCFSQDNHVLSTPQSLSHAATFQYTFYNLAHIAKTCQSPASQKIFYDKSTPEITFTLGTYSGSALTREYVNNDGILYDGKQVGDKKFFHITNSLEFEANAALTLKMNLQDKYYPAKIQEGVSGLSSYKLQIFQKNASNWELKLEDEKSFPHYNASGTIFATDSYLLDLQSLSGIQEVLTKLGSYQVQLTVFDAAGNETRSIFYYDIRAGQVDPIKSFLEVSHRNDVYANNSSSYEYTLTLKDAYGNVIPGKDILSIEQGCSAPDCKILRTNMAGTPSGQEALQFEILNTLSDVNGKIRFLVRSLSPGTFTEKFKVEFAGSVNYTFSSLENTFLKPLVGVLEVYTDGGWYADRLPLEVEKKYRVLVKNKDAGSYAFSLSNFDASIQARHPLTSFSLSGSLIQSGSGAVFFGTFHSTLPSSESHKTLLEIQNAGISDIVISYTLAGKNIKYFLSPGTLGNQPLILTDTRELQNPVKVIGNLQGVGNTQNASERQNISDLDSAQMRNIFRKNLEEYIRNRENNSLVGGIKYIDKTGDSDKNYIIESNPSYETLVVRNGNILIQNDFNSAGNKIGIISYKDSGYNVETGYTDVGNIYIEPEVSKIIAAIYADGAIISTKNGNPMSSDLALRTPLLQNQLRIFGLLFSRNTLAGARELSGKYILPGDQKTTNSNLAVQYDLYFLRRGSENCEKDAYGFCNIPQYCIVEYDSKLMLSPPKLFVY